MKDIRGKQALITGAASGIGRAIALALARQGADLFLVDINQRDLEAVAEEARRQQVQATACLADLARRDAISRVVASVLDRWGGLDILVNNAGIAYYGPMHEMSDAQWDRILAVNLHAPIQFTRELLPALLQRPEGHILNVCSIAGLVAGPRMAAYQVTKFGLVGFSESLRAEYGPRGLGVTTLCPGLVRTGLFQAVMTAPNRAAPRPPKWLSASPEHVAARAIRAIHGNQGLVLITPMAHFLWAVKRLSPTLLDYVQRLRRRRHRHCLADVARANEPAAIGFAAAAACDPQEPFAAERQPSLPFGPHSSLRRRAAA